MPRRIALVPILLLVLAGLPGCGEDARAPELFAVQPDSPEAKAFVELADKVAAAVSARRTPPD